MTCNPKLSPVGEDEETHFNRQIDGYLPFFARQMFHDFKIGWRPAGDPYRIQPPGGSFKNAAGFYCDNDGKSATIRPLHRTNTLRSHGSRHPMNSFCSLTFQAFGDRGK
jgi:hypothetical protein